MVVVISLAFGAWLAVKYCLLFGLSDPSHAAKVSALLCVMLGTMLSSEIADGCPTEWGYNIVYILAAMVPLACPDFLYVGELGTLAYVLRIALDECYVRSAVCGTISLMVVAFC